MSLRRIVGGLGVAGAAGLAYATLVEPRWYALRHVRAPVLRPAALGDLTVLHLSDLHLWPRRTSVARFLADCAAADPDVVVLTGDVLGHADVVDEAIGLLSYLAEGRTAVGVLGSNDRYGPVGKNPLRYLSPSRYVDEEPRGGPLDAAGLVDGLSQAGWQMVDNRAVRVDTPAGVVDVRGVGDAHMHADALDAVSWEPPGADVALSMGVTHAPYTRVLDRMDRAALDLALAGHTHGGQVRVPGLGALVANCDLPLSQARGLSGYGAGLSLHVSAGLGQSRYAPIRFACRPEATLLHLTGEL